MLVPSECMTLYIVLRLRLIVSANNKLISLY